LELLWKDAYKRLGARPEDNIMVQPLPIPATEYNMAAAFQKTQEKMSQVAFERLQVPELVLRPRPLLSLRASGRETGLVVQAGHGGIDIVPIYEGYVIPHATLSLALGGKDVNKYLQKRLNQKGIHGVDAQTCQRIKEELCYVALDFDKEMASGAQEERFALPDEQLLHISSERFEGPEVLFQTHLIGKKSAGVHETAYNAVMRCDLDIRLELYSNIILVSTNQL
jgi:actin-related protein